jgi:hypothetical protein
VTVLADCESGAGNGIRTRDVQLGKLTLYQLSYARSPGTGLYHTESGVLKVLGDFWGGEVNFGIRIASMNKDEHAKAHIMPGVHSH